MIEVKNLKKKFGENLIWQDVNATIKKGDCVSIIGPSGCGKTTFLRCLNLLEQPTEGSVLINGVDITQKGVNLDQIRRKMGMVYQNFNLFSHLTVLENIIMAPMLIDRISKQDAIKLGMECLAMVGLIERADFMPTQLSGGQKQRVAIARCLAMKPEVILFDEPTSALDPTMVDEVLSVIRNLAKNGMTCIIVTHEMAFAKSVSSEIFYMDQQSLYERGTPREIFEHPQKEKTRIFIQRIKTLEYIIQHKEFDMYDLQGKINIFGQKQALTSKQIYALQLLTEEVVVSQIIPHQSSDSFEIKLTIGYNDRAEKTEVGIEYPGPEWNPLTAEAVDELSAMIMKNLTKDSVFSFQDERNFLRIQL